MLNCGMLNYISMVRSVADGNSRSVADGNSLLGVSVPDYCTYLCICNGCGSLFKYPSRREKYFLECDLCEAKYKKQLT